MIRTVLLTAIVLAMSVGGGAGSVWYVLNGTRGVGAVQVGSWTAFPDFGTPQADPYSRARFARQGGLSLGKAEGIGFVAERDRDGRLLRRDCDYRIEGRMPAARFWTIYAGDDNNVVLPPLHRRVPAISSAEVIRESDSRLVVTIGRHAAPGNWLGIGGIGPMRFMLTLYDTQLSGALGAGEMELPAISRVSCDV